MSVTSSYLDLRLANGMSWLGNQIFQSLEIETLIEEFHNHFKLLVYKHIDKCIETKSMGQRGSSLSLLSLSLGESLNHVRICIHGNFFYF